jgi:hypothetical protein
MDPRWVEISDSLRRKLEEAQTEYRCAAAEYKRLMNISRDTNDATDPALRDGVYAMRRALQIHEQAYRNYTRALKVFTDFTLYGKLQPEDSQP